MGASAIVKEMVIGRASVYRALGYVLLNTLCISYGHIHGRGLVLFQVAMGSFVCRCQLASTGNRSRALARRLTTAGASIPLRCPDSDI